MFVCEAGQQRAVPCVSFSIGFVSFVLVRCPCPAGSKLVDLVLSPFVSICEMALSVSDSWEFPELAAWPMQHAPCTVRGALDGIRGTKNSAITSAIAPVRDVT